MRLHAELPELMQAPWLLSLLLVLCRCQCCAGGPCCPCCPVLQGNVCAAVCCLDMQECDMVTESVLCRSAMHPLHAVWISDPRNDKAARRVSSCPSALAPWRMQRSLFSFLASTKRNCLQIQQGAQIKEMGLASKLQAAQGCGGNPYGGPPPAGGAPPTAPPMPGGAAPGVRVWDSCRQPACMQCTSKTGSKHLHLTYACRSLPQSLPASTGWWHGPLPAGWCASSCAVPRTGRTTRSLALPKPLPAAGRRTGSCSSLPQPGPAATIWYEGKGAW